MTRVVIIGGGPAGAAAGVGLARRGLGVVIVEGKTFPRAKVCGEFVSPAATGVLESLLPPAALREAGARTVGRFVLEEGEREVWWEMPARAWVLSRRTLDDRLLGAARGAGCEVVQPATVRAVRWGPRVARVDIARAGGAVETLEADVVVHADGSGRHDSAGPTPVRAGVLGLKAHLRVPGGVAGLRMRSAARAYGGLVGVEGGAATAALVARRDVVARHGGDGDALLGEMWPAYRPEWREGGWMWCGVAGSGYIGPGNERSFRIGNAAAAVEPVGGEGIGLALWSGALLGEILDPGDLAGTQRAVARAYRSRLRTRGAACRVAAECLMRPRLMRGLWPLLGVSAVRGGVLGAFYALSGKPAA
ncbi:MAG: FAD-dependent monooxygenase [Phycisphaerales bacterium]|nr:FAD-dependent monooxygenase [Phycisphaerales bacterium]